MEVATREGGVDRNFLVHHGFTPPRRVATREGGVDRNATKRMNRHQGNASPPARVAWIETQRPAPLPGKG